MHRQYAVSVKRAVKIFGGELESGGIVVETAGASGVGDGGLLAEAVVLRIMESWTDYFCLPLRFTLNPLNSYPLLK